MGKQLCFVRRWVNGESVRDFFIQELLREEILQQGVAKFW